MMSQADKTNLVRHIRRLIVGDQAEGLTDRELLERFVVDGDDSAFRFLARRHASLVVGVCRRQLRDTNDIDDVFQAVLLVMAKNAKSIRYAESLAGWLHTVAFRLARRALHQRKRRERMERSLANVSLLMASDLGADRHANIGIDEELARLPGPLRQAIMLCDVEGLSQDRAAALLGWPRGSIHKRLSKGRALLAKRLARRGITLTAGFGTVFLPATTPGMATDHLERCLDVALAEAAGQATVVSILSMISANEHLRITMMTRLSIAAAILVLTIGAVAVGARMQTAKPADQELAIGEAREPRRERPLLKDRYGDSLPPAALARCGTVRGVAVGMTSMAFSPNAKHVAWADNAVRLVDPETGLERRVFSESNKAGFAFVHFSRDGTKVYAGNGTGVFAWDVASGRESLHIKTPNLRWMALSPGGNLLATLDTQDLVIHNATTGAKLRSWNPVGPANALAWSVDGKFIASHCGTPTNECFSGVIHVWDAETGKQIKKCENGTSFTKVVFLHDGRLLSLGYPNGAPSCLLWDFAQAKPTEIDKPNLEGRPRLSPDGKTLAVARSRFIHFFDTATWKLRQSLEIDLGEMAWAPDSRSVAIMALDQSLSVWDTREARPTRVFANSIGAVHGLRFAPNADRFLSTHVTGQIRLWDGETAMPADRWQYKTGYHEPCGMAFARDGKTYATTWAGLDDSVAIFTLGIGEARVTFTPREDAYYGRVHGVAFSPVRDYLACGDETGRISTWEWDLPRFGRGKVKKKHVWKADPDAIRCLAFSKDGKVLYAASGGLLHGVAMSKDINIKAWNPTTGKLLRTFDAHKGGIYGMALSTDGRRLFACGDEGTLHTWETATGKSIDATRAKQGRLLALAISASGEWLATAGEDGSVALWDAQTLKQCGRGFGHRGPVHALDFRPDGQRLASGSADATVLMWDVSALK